MSSATGALKKQSEIGDNEEQQSARRLPAAATAGWQIIARETVIPFFFSRFSWHGKASQCDAHLYQFLTILERDIAPLSKARRHVAFY